MNNTLKIFFAAGLLLALGCNSCKQKPADNGADYTISPEAGTTYKAGDVVKVKVGLPADTKPDSVVYLMEETRLGVAKDSSAISVKTDTIPLGIKLITAKVYQAGKSQDVSTNILLLAAKAPEAYTYKVEKTYPHDTSSYTEGLEYLDGIMYESTGEAGHSTIRKNNLETGKAIQLTKLRDQYFGEGLSVVGNKVIQLTYREKVGFVYDKSSLKLLNTFPNNVGAEGWGMCFDGKKLYMDDSTNKIWFLNKDTYQEMGSINVCDDKKQIDSVNELEYIDGKLYANVYQTDDILVINPKTGAVEQKIDMKNLYPESERPAGRDWGNNVLNGIAYDAATKRIFVTGKKWPKMYQVKFSPKAQ
ncbi:glutaminyl-peptide cyclotransferase [Mucilaginibacter sp. KACC 22773]|uniref:glutaminyl-peptide cyclotransferase n=1 Tax=Mucilaginibacter sp. KACC 22773 TaxID=3025671 RepID=UPI002365B9A7|nr:glutaminyl-peptide cyclotransferase [Mucilaginibacter sp. KACC 22773]WDF77270.1 glutaminyl-peptide cyclotransferase [Mucilaginibacter sp. KACC 22773]